MRKDEGERRLAAILSADVAGYSKLMGDDERATVRTLTDYRKVFGDHIARHKGRVVDTAGDSVLASFGSVVEAVQCAVNLQSELASRNSALPEERRMHFRVGINLGDVIEQDDGTIYGDGVNIAARLESLAEPGGITVSGTVFDHAENKLPVAFEFSGEQAVKNISKPVRAYRVVAATEAGVSPSAVDPLMLPDKPSIAVLAFDNLSGDPGQAYFADGVAEDIIIELCKVSGLFVIARNSSFSYKGQVANIEAVCRELGVRYILEGSVRKAGSRVRITAQLIDGRTGGHLWAERYDRRLDDIFEVQDEVTHEIVSALKVSLTPEERIHLDRRGTSNLDAYDAFMRGREWAMTWTRAGHEKARPYLEKAIALDQKFADPLAYLAMIPMVAYFNHWGKNWQAGLDAGHKLASKAVGLDDQSPHAHWALGTILLWESHLENAMAEAQRVIDIDPNFAGAHTVMGMALHYLGDSDSALAYLQTALRLDPIGDDHVLHQMGLCHIMLGDYGAAETALRNRISRTPTTDASRVALAAIYGHLGRIDEARAIWAEMMNNSPGYSFAEKRKILPYKNTEDADRIAEGLRKAGLDIPDESTAAD